MPFKLRRPNIVRIMMILRTTLAGVLGLALSACTSEAPAPGTTPAAKSTPAAKTPAAKEAPATKVALTTTALKLSKVP